MKKVEPLIKVRSVQLLAPPDTTSSKNIVRFVVTRKELEELQRQYPDVKVIFPIKTFKLNPGVTEKDILYLVEISKGLYDSATDLRNRFRKEARESGGGGGDNPPQSSIFHRLIDKDLMSDCIIEITGKIFHGEKECQICQKTFNKYEFYLLIQYY